MKDITFKTAAARERFSTVVDKLSFYGPVECSSRYEGEYVAKVKLPFKGPRLNDLTGGDLIISVAIKEREKDIHAVYAAHLPNEAAFEAAVRRHRESREVGFIRNESHSVFTYKVPFEHLGRVLTACVVGLTEERRNWMPAPIDEWAVEAKHRHEAEAVSA